MLIGAIADDLTGATDLALTLSRHGMRAAQLVGVPESNRSFDDVDAVVVALKLRTIAADEAVAQSVAAAQKLLTAGARQLFFKYCSTFDSTDAGNIGPVAEALLALTGDLLTLACPAFPANGRTVYQGHLFVGDQLLSDSPMRDHPLTPMRDANLVRVLQRQTSLEVGLIPYATVNRGVKAIVNAFEARRGIVIVDAVSDSDLRTIGEAASTLKLITGASGIALGLPENFRRAGLLARRGAATAIASSPGRTIILSGSCSQQTRSQIDYVRRAGWPFFKVDPLAIAEGDTTVEKVLDYIANTPADAVPVIYSSADPEAVEHAQERLGREQAGVLVESLLAGLARRLIQERFTRFIVAGGETSGAVVSSLGIKAFEIGPEIDPGVPWVVTREYDPVLTMALKSGNFGADDFFAKAAGQLK
jgi:3-dehydrotetronate 4-kinase